MGAKNNKYFFLMLLDDGYAVLDETDEPKLVGGGSIKEVVEYLQLCGARREDVQFIELDEADFGDGKKNEILKALPLSIV